MVVERPAEKPTKTKWQRYWWLVPVGGVVVAGVVVVAAPPTEPLVEPPEAAALADFVTIAPDGVTACHSPSRPWPLT